MRLCLAWRFRQSAGLTITYRYPIGCPIKCRLLSRCRNAVRFGEGSNVRRSLEPRIHGLAFHRKNSECALMHAAQRFRPDESLQSLHAQRELAQRKRAFA